MNISTTRPCAEDNPSRTDIQNGVECDFGFVPQFYKQESNIG